MQILMWTISCNALGIEAVAVEKLSLTVGKLLDETVRLAQSLNGAERARMLTHIAAMYAKTGSPGIASSLFHQATGAVGQFDEAHPSVEITELREIISAERKSENREALGKTVATTLLLLQQRAMARDAEKLEPVQKPFFRLDGLLDAAGVHAAAGEIDEAKTILQEVTLTLSKLNWEQQGLLRQLLARLQAKVGDDEGARTTLSENETYFRRFSRSYDRPLLPFFHEVSSMCLVAEAQFRAEHHLAAQETLKKAHAKAKAISTSNEGQSDDGPRSAALRSVAMVAAEIGATALAIKAQREITNAAYQGTISLVIRALARSGDGSAAQKLAAENKCCSDLLALGLAEHEDWEASVRADEARYDNEEGDWERDHNYFLEVARARVLARDANEALTWARQKPKTTSDKILALLGVAEGVAAKEATEQLKEKRKGVRNQFHDAR